MDLKQKQENKSDLKGALSFREKDQKGSKKTSGWTDTVFVSVQRGWKVIRCAGFKSEAKCYMFGSVVAAPSEKAETSQEIKECLVTVW